MKEGIKVKMDKLHTEMLEALTPFFGKDNGEVLKNIAIRWMEEHIGTEAIEKLEEIGAVKGFRTEEQS